GRRLGVVRRRDYAPLGARRIADRDAAVTVRLGPVFHVQVELAEIVALRVQPRLRIHPTAELLGSGKGAAGRKHLAEIAGPLSDQSPIGEDGPLPVADDLPAVE